MAGEARRAWDGGAAPAAPAAYALVAAGRWSRRAAFAAVIVLATGPGRAERQLVTRYVTAWEHGDYGRMYALLDPASRQRTEPRRGSPPRYRRDATHRDRCARSRPITSATARRQRRSRSRCGRDAAVRDAPRDAQVPLTAAARAPPCSFTSTLLFPGLQARRAADTGRCRCRRARRCWPATARRWPRARTAPRRSPTSPIRSSARSARSRPTRPPRTPPRAIRRTPRSATTDSSACSRPQLAGTPGGTLLAGHRVLARTTPVPGHDVTTTIDPTLERAAVAAIGGRYAGIAAMDPRTGAVLALAGIAFSDVQPPGSTMKIITATGALEAGIVKPAPTFPISHQREPRRLHPPERRRRGVRRHAPERVRGLLQLGVRAARRQARRHSAWSTSPSGSASTSHPRSPAPRRARSRRRARSAATWRSAPRRSGRARSRRPRWR